MFQLRHETDYAIQFLNLLAKSKKQLSLNDVANRTGVSFLFLQKIARKLRMSGLVKAEQGVNGGYSLVVPVKSLSLKDIIKAVEGKCGLVDCCGGANGDCNKKTSCQVKRMMGKVNKEIMKILDDVKLVDM
jgi:Rrf2 family protein